jgi:hypothetical protein
MMNKFIDRLLSKTAGAAKKNQNAVAVNNRSSSTSQSHVFPDCFLQLNDCDSTLFATNASVWARASPMVAETILSSRPVFMIKAITGLDGTETMLPVFAIDQEIAKTTPVVIFAVLFDICLNGALDLSIDEISFNQLLSLSLALHTTPATFLLIEKALGDRELARIVASALLQSDKLGFFEHMLAELVRRFQTGWITDDIVPRKTLRAMLDCVPILDAHHAVALAAAAETCASARLLKRCKLFLIRNQCRELQRLVEKPPVQFPLALWRALIQTNMVDVLMCVNTLAERMREKAAAKTTRAKLQRFALAMHLFAHL